MGTQAKPRPCPQNHTIGTDPGTTKPRSQAYHTRLLRCLLDFCTASDMKALGDKPGNETSHLIV